MCVSWNDNEKGTMEIGMLKEHGNSESWVKLFSFGCQLLCPYSFLALTGEGKFLVHIDGVYIHLIDVGQNPPSSKKIMRIGMGEDIVNYVETLISPFNSVEAQK